MKEKYTPGEEIPSNPDEMIIGMSLVSSIRQEFNFFVGRLLTQLEASLPEGKQTEALKMITKNEMWRLNDIIQRYVYQYADVLKKKVEIEKLAAAEHETPMVVNIVSTEKVV